MAITPRLEIKQSQSLLMTPELRQAINILQLNNTELNELIEQEIEQNPLLEKEDDILNNQEYEQNKTIDDTKDTLSSEEEILPDISYETSFDDDFGSDREGYGTEDYYDWSSYNKSKDSHTADPDYDYFEQKLAAEKSLYSFINEQIIISFHSTKDRIIAQSLCEHLDAAGYFRGNTTEIAQKLKCPQSTIANILNRLKEFEPSGIFAENLKECLTIQLKDIDRYNPMIAKVLDNLSLLAEGNIKKLLQICNTSSDNLSEMISDIKSLNPKPAATWNIEPSSYIIPDIFVKRNKYGEYRVELNNMSLPKLLINNKYNSNLSISDKNTERYLKEKISSANFLIKAMHQRATTILRISEEIVKIQHNFFEYGIDYLKPLNLKDLAYNLELHESTISRATTNKYMHTPCGIFELKYFFSSAAGSYVGNEDISTHSIKHKIKTLINSESPKQVLSDDKIADILAQEGIKIARRTVAKYRESLGIPTSAERKRQNNTK